MQKKWLIIAVIVCVLIGGAVWVNMQSLKKLPSGFEGSNGRLELQRLDVASLYPGRVIDIKVQEGDLVKKDEVLVVLSAEQSHSLVEGAQASKQRAEEAVHQAEAEIAARKQQLKVAQLELDNALQLKKEDLISVVEVQRRQAARDGEAAAVKATQAARESAIAAVNQAQAQMNIASSANKDMFIRAPQTGRVEYRIAELGNVVGPGSKVITLLDPSDVTLSIFLPTDTVGKLKLGDDAIVVLDGIDAVWPAKITFIASNTQFTPKYVETANEREKLMYKVKLRIPQQISLQYQGVLKGGLTGNGYVRTNPQEAWPVQWQAKLPQLQQNARTQ